MSRSIFSISLPALLLPLAPLAADCSDSDADNDVATQGQVLLGSAEVTENYCVRVYDATDQFAGPVTLRSHPRHY